MDIHDWEMLMHEDAYVCSVCGLKYTGQQMNAHDEIRPGVARVK